MFKSKKTFGAVCALSLLAGSAFAETEFSFTNKVSSDIVNIAIPKDGSGNTTEFAGIQNKTVVDFTSEKVDAGLDIRFFFNTVKSTRPSDGTDYEFGLFGGATHTDLDGNNTFGYFMKDYYIEYRPVEILTIGFHDTVNTNGSYLPIWDDNAGTGNLGSDLGIVLRPIEGLRIATGFDFISAIGSEANDPLGSNFIWNAGIDYTLEETFSVGFTARNMLTEDRSFGFYGSFEGVDGLVLTAGFGINEADVADLVSGNVLMLSAQYEDEDNGWNTKAEMVTNFKNENSDTDLYIAAAGEYAFDENWASGVEVKSYWNLNDAEDTGTYEIHPYATWSHDIHTLEAGVNFVFAKDATGFSFPVSYKISF